MPLCVCVCVCVHSVCVCVCKLAVLNFVLITIMQCTTITVLVEYYHVQICVSVLVKSVHVAIWLIFDRV